VTDASEPITSASTKIETSTWRRLAPSVRIVASSRVRCAIVIESEFAITKLPTKSAMPPNASRNVRRKEMNEFVCFASSRACCVPDRACAALGRIARTSLSTRASETFGFAAIAISSRRPCLWKRRWAVGRSKPARVAPPSALAVPNLTIPEIRNCLTGPSL
jgi:hypothetical protein